MIWWLVEFKITVTKEAWKIFSPLDRCQLLWTDRVYTLPSFGTQAFEPIRRFKVWIFVFSRVILEMQHSEGLHDLGSVKWDMAICLLIVYLICYFSLWKGISTSGKVSGPGNVDFYFCTEIKISNCRSIYNNILGSHFPAESQCFGWLNWQ